MFSFYGFYQLCFHRFHDFLELSFDEFSVKSKRYDIFVFTNFYDNLIWREKFNFLEIPEIQQNSRENGL